VVIRAELAEAYAFLKELGDGDVLPTARGRALLAQLERDRGDALRRSGPADAAGRSRPTIRCARPNHRRADECHRALALAALARDRGGRRGAVAGSAREATGSSGQVIVRTTTADRADSAARRGREPAIRVSSPAEVER
jgi:hypothetical protein